MNGANELPVVRRSARLPKPQGGGLPLVILHWAGFRAAITYTFDDERPSQKEHWTELRASRVPATYYLSPGLPGAANGDAIWKNALELGNEIGNHTVHHCHFDLSDCIAAPPRTIRSEIDGCTSYLSALGAPAVWTMAYPFGDARYALDAKERFVLARGVRDGRVAPVDATDPWDLPVRGVAGGETAADLVGIIDEARELGHWSIFVFHTLLPNRLESQPYAAVDVGHVTASMDYAKARGDVWADTLVSIGTYWIGERLLHGAVPTVAGSESTWRWTLPAHFPPGRKVRVTVGGGTLWQGGAPLSWDDHGYYEVALDPGILRWSH